MKKRKVGETSEGISLERRTKAKHDGVAPDKKQKGVQEKKKKLATKIKKIDVVANSMYLAVKSLSGLNLLA